MTESFNRDIKMPVWLVTLLTTTFIGFMGVVIAITASANTVKEKVSQNERKIEIQQKVIDTKADSKDIDRIYIQLNRIENKLDEIQKQK